MGKFKFGDRLECCNAEGKIWQLQTIWSLRGRKVRAKSIVVAAVTATLLSEALAQQSVQPAYSQDASKIVPITLRTRIALPCVYGRMDHYGWDNKRGILIVSALGNNTVEIVDQWRRVHTITGLEHPQASIYVPDADRIAVSSQSGKLRFYDAESYALIKTLDFGTAANTNNMRYDPVTKLIYVGYGERQHGAIAVVDPATMERRQDFRVGSHPESFQLETKGPRIFVNLPDQEGLGVVDRETAAVTRWKIPGNTNNHSLALDESTRRLFTASLQPGKLMVIDADTGNVVADFPCVLGVDDLWFDAARKRIYATGAGSIDVFQQHDPDHYVVIANIPLEPEQAARASTSRAAPRTASTCPGPTCCRKVARRCCSFTSMTRAIR
jgi:hypothetical protein